MNLETFVTTEIKKCSFRLHLLNSNFRCLLPTRSHHLALTANMFTFNNAPKKDLLMFCFVFLGGVGGEQKSIKNKFCLYRNVSVPTRVQPEYQGFSKGNGKKCQFCLKCSVPAIAGKGCDNRVHNDAFVNVGN